MSSETTRTYGAADAIVWCASTAEALRLPSAASDSSEDDSTRAQRLRKAPDRDRFLAARALLRHALSDAVDGRIPLAEWRFRDGANGKPMMAPGLPRIAFNLSHAGGCVAVGISLSSPIGVDVESLAREDRIDIVEDALTERERACLRGLPPDLGWNRFIRLWTVKEACGKALGLGVALDFTMLEAELDPPRVLAAEGVLGDGERFDVATRMATYDGCPYCLSVACTTNAPLSTSFRFRSLAAHRTTPLADTSGHGY